MEDAALKKYKRLYQKKPDGGIALRIAEIYAVKGKVDNRFMDLSSNWYIEAGIRFKQNGDNARGARAFERAFKQMIKEEKQCAGVKWEQVYPRSPRMPRDGNSASGGGVYLHGLKGIKKICLLKRYLKRFGAKGSTGQKMSMFAMYWQSVEYYELGGYAASVNWARFVLHNVSSLPPPETARLYLVLSSCFRIESSPVLDRDKALFYLKKNISYSREHGLEDVLKEALRIQKAASPHTREDLTPGRYSTKKVTLRPVFSLLFRLSSLTEKPA
jgi:hypothetical protein